MDIKKECLKLFGCFAVYFVIIVLSFCYCAMFVDIEDLVYEISSALGYASYLSFGWFVLIELSLTKVAHKLMEKTSGLLQFIPYASVFFFSIMTMISLIFIFIIHSLMIATYLLFLLISLYAIKYLKYELNYYDPQLSKMKAKQYIYYFINYWVMFVILASSLSLLLIFKAGFNLWLLMVYILIGIVVPTFFFGGFVVSIYFGYTKFFHYPIKKL